MPLKIRAIKSAHNPAVEAAADRLVEEARAARKALNAPPPYGGMKYSEDGTLSYCHVCGKGYRNLGAHSAWKHGLDADTYREIFGLAARQSLDPPSLRHVKREHAIERDQAAVAAQYRDPELWRHGVRAIKGVPLRAGARQSRARLMKARIEAGVPIWGQRGWTQAEIKLLGTDIDRVVAERLGRTATAVLQKRQRLGIPAYQEGT